jgi:predicted membrane channel-forming protein YqfA (hemolysin III family)
MPLVRPKSFVAGLLILGPMVKSVISASSQGHTSAFHKFTLVFGTAVAALFILDGFKGQKATPRDELRTSVLLSIMFLLLCLLSIFRHRLYFEPATIAVGIIYLFGAAYYFRAALQERQLLDQIGTN